VFVKCDLEVCKRRDPHGLYKQAMQGELQEFPGISAPYEPPPHPALTVETDLQSVEMIVAQIMTLLKQKKMIP
jgi:adenylylsulfate kinase-like enzyme